MYRTLIKMIMVARIVQPTREATRAFRILSLFFLSVGVVFVLLSVLSLLAPWLASFLQRISLLGDVGLILTGIMALLAGDLLFSFSKLSTNSSGTEVRVTEPGLLMELFMNSDYRRRNEGWVVHTSGFHMPFLELEEPNFLRWPNIAIHVIRVVEKDIEIQVKLIAQRSNAMSWNATINLTLRMTSEDWLRFRSLALSGGAKIQQGADL